MDNNEEITRRETLGIFKAVAVLGAGLMVSRHSFGQGGVMVQEKHFPKKLGLGVDPDARPFVVEFELTQQKDRRNLYGIEKRKFSIELPEEMVKMLWGDPHVDVQVKFAANTQKGRYEFGQAQVKLNQAVLQQKDFIIHEKWQVVQDKWWKLPADIVGPDKA